MGSADESRNLRLDPELLGHDPELATTVESLRHAPDGADASGSRPDEAAPLSPRRVSSPESRDSSPVIVPSGFVTRALPVTEVAPGPRLPWKGLMAAGLLCIVCASGVAWGMVYLLEPSVFAKEPRSPSSHVVSGERAPGTTARGEPTRAAVASAPPAASASAPAFVALAPSHPSLAVGSVPAARRTKSVAAGSAAEDLAPSPEAATVSPEKKPWFE